MPLRPVGTRSRAIRRRATKEGANGKKEKLTVHQVWGWYSSAAANLAGCAARGASIPAVVFDWRATKHPAKIRAALRVGAAPRLAALLAR